MTFMIGEYYNGRALPAGYTLAQIVDIAKAKGADGIRLYCRAGVEAVNMPLLNQVLDMLKAKGFKVLFCPFMNWQDHAGYFGSAAWFQQWENLANTFKGDDRIWAYELFNEPSSTTWAPGITGIAGVQDALAACIDRIRATGDNHPIVLPDNMVYNNYTWTIPPQNVRANTLQAAHISGSKYASDTYVTGVNFWEQWMLNRILSFESRYPDIPVIIDEVSIGNGTWAPWQFQKDFIVALVNWCLATNHDFSWHLYGWDLNPSSDFYHGKTTEVLALTNLGKPPQCPIGFHWDVNAQACVSDIPTCPPGYHWDANQQSCQPDIPTCPLGQHWDSVLKQCVSDVPSFVLDVWAVSGGTTTPTGRNSYPSGTPLTITATAAEGYVFGGWLVNNQPRTENPLTLTITENLTVMPIFNVAPEPPPPPQNNIVGAAAAAVVITIVTGVLYALSR